MSYKRNPNNIERDESALKVSCPYCGAAIGEMCWTLRTTSGDSRRPEEKTLWAPHRHRIKAAWRKQFKERNAA